MPDMIVTGIITRCVWKVPTDASVCNWLLSYVNVENEFRFGSSGPWMDEDGNYDVVLETVSL